MWITLNKNCRKERDNSKRMSYSTCEGLCYNLNVKELHPLPENQSWDGHSFKDSCEWRRYHEVDVSNGFPRVSWESSVRRVQSYERLRNEYLAGKYEVMNTYAEGETFEMKYFQLGTVVRMTRVSQSSSLLWYMKEKIQAVSLYGILDEESGKNGDRDVLVCFRADQVENSDSYHHPHGSFVEDLTVGEVNHSKIIFGEKTFIFAYAPFDREQVIEKITDLEVLSYGNRPRGRRKRKEVDEPDKNRLHVPDGLPQGI